jgi:hypothetical protein
MSRLAGRLSDPGFLVDNFDYPSTREPFDELVELCSKGVGVLAGLWFGP